jgi:hypothetical protein
MLARPKAAAQQTVVVKLLQPHRVVHIGLPTRHVLDVASIDEQHFEASRFENLEYRHPIHARRLHRDRCDSDRLQPVGEPMQVAGEAPERTNWLRISVRWYPDHVEGRPYVETGCIGVNGNQGARRGLHASRGLCHRLCSKKPTRRGGRQDTFLNGIAERHQSQVRGHPRAMFFSGLEAPKGGRPLLSETSRYATRSFLANRPSPPNDICRGSRELF